MNLHSTEMIWPTTNGSAICNAATDTSALKTAEAGSHVTTLCKPGSSAGDEAMEIIHILAIKEYLKASSPQHAVKEPPRRKIQKTTPKRRKQDVQMAGKVGREAVSELSEESKQQRRKEMNRKSAIRSRHNSKQYMEELTSYISAMEASNNNLKIEIEKIRSANAMLRDMINQSAIDARGRMQRLCTSSGQAMHGACQGYCVTDYGMSE